METTKKYLTAEEMYFKEYNTQANPNIGYIAGVTTKLMQLFAKQEREKISDAIISALVNTTYTDEQKNGMRQCLKIIDNLK